MAGDAEAASRVTLVTVSYNSAAVLTGLLATVPRGVRMVVVDNGGSDETPAIAAGFGARLVRLPVNQGFGRGCNAGAAGAATEFLFFVNPDAELREGCVGALVAAADAAPDVSGFNPLIVGSDGRPEFRHRSVHVDRKRWLPRDVPANSVDVPVLHGSALFCRRAAFEAVGGFDPGIFLYHEDDDLSVRLVRDAGPIRIAPAAVVMHKGGHSSGRTAAVARFKGFHMARSRAYVMAKHGKPLVYARTLVRAALELILPHNLLSSRRRAKHLGQFAGALSAWRDGGAYRDA